MKKRWEKQTDLFAPTALTAGKRTMLLDEEMTRFP